MNKRLLDLLQNSKRQSGFLIWFFPGGDLTPPPVFRCFHYGNRFKMGKMYEALTVMVFNQLLSGLHTYHYILSKCSTQVSVNLIDGLSINRGK